MQAVQAYKLHWLGLRVDPIKGRPAPEPDLIALGIVSLLPEGPCRNFRLPDSMRTKMLQVQTGTVLVQSAARP